jgi:histone acetyltransferase (RNA polymerase elongator complex component)
MKQQYIIPIFVPHKGCPNDCIFCNQKKIAKSIEDIKVQDVEKQIQEYLLTIPERAHKEIAFYGGSFTGIDINEQNILLDIALKYKNKGKINGIRLSTRPDYIDENILDNLIKHGVTEIELGVQSMDNEVLGLNKRGHEREQVIKSVNLIKKYPLRLGLQMMVGLYGSSMNKDIDTAKEIIKLKPDFVRIYPTLVVNDTYLKVLYENKEYVPLALEECIELCSYLLSNFEMNKIPVIRLGLQATDNITYGKDMVAGPFHPSFRELVESKIIFETVNKLLLNVDLTHGEVKLKVNPQNVSKFVGEKKRNLNMWNMMFNVNIKIIQDEKIKCNDFILLTHDKEYYIERKKYIKNFEFK